MLLWLRIAGVGLLILGVVFVGWRVRESYTQKTQIEELKTQVAANLATLEKLKLQHAKNTTILTQRSSRDIKAAVSTARQREVIRHVKPEDDGITRPVLRDTLKFLRETDDNTARETGNTK